MRRSWAVLAIARALAAAIAPGCRPESALEDRANLMLLGFQSDWSACGLVWSTSELPVTAPRDLNLVAVELDRSVPSVSAAKREDTGADVLEIRWRAFEPNDEAGFTEYSAADLPLPRLVARALVTPETGCAQCGTMSADPYKRCDDGNTTGGDGCSASCDVEPGWTCDRTGPCRR